MHVGRGRLQGGVMVPSLGGLEVRDAAAVCAELDLELRHREPRPALIGRHVVVAQDPLPDTRARRGAVVSVSTTEEGGGSAGVREPRRPRPSPRSVCGPARD